LATSAGHLEGADKEQFLKASLTAKARAAVEAGFATAGEQFSKSIKDGQAKAAAAAGCDTVGELLMEGKARAAAAAGFCHFHAWPSWRCRCQV